MDPLGRISDITLAAPGALTGALTAGTKIAHYVYRGVERLARRELPSGISSAFAYDGASRLTAIQHMKGPNILTELHYVYDSVDRRPNHLVRACATTTRPV